MTILTNSPFSIYERLLRLGDDWSVSGVELDELNDILHITIRYKHSSWTDEDTGEVFPIFDFRTERVWRHLDCMEFQTHVHCRLPRIKTSDGKVQTIEYDWAESGFSYTKKFENKCVTVLQSTYNRKSAADLMRVSDDKICSLMHAAVQRGLSRRDLSDVGKISLDEKFYRKGHQYITVLTNSETGTVLDVEKDRTQASAERLLKRTLDTDILGCISTTCCDMWEPFINALKKIVRMPNLCTINFTLSNI
jgi:transposase